LQDFRDIFSVFKFYQILGFDMTIFMGMNTLPHSTQSQLHPAGASHVQHNAMKSDKTGERIQTARDIYAVWLPLEVGTNLHLKKTSSQQLMFPNTTHMHSSNSEMGNGDNEKLQKRATSGSSATVWASTTSGDETELEQYTHWAVTHSKDASSALLQSGSDLSVYLGGGHLKGLDERIQTNVRALQLDSGGLQRRDSDVYGHHVSGCEEILDRGGRQNDHRNSSE